jgi:hypothetical protein
MLTDDQTRQIAATVAAVLDANWREGTRAGDGMPYAYTCPSSSRYPWQWYWDSAFHAIVWGRRDPDRARRELESLLANQRDDGFIGHTIFWNQPLRGLRRATYNVTTRHPTMTASIQPPMLPWAWSLAVGDAAAEPRLRRHLDWFAAQRDLEGDGLIWIVQPDESGMDAATQFDPIWRHRAHGLPGYVTLVHRNRRLNYDLRRVAGAGGPVVCEVATNVLYNLSRLAVGRPSLTPALIARCWDESRGLFLPVARPEVPRSALPMTIAALTPLALPDLPEAIGRRLVQEHLLAPDRFWTPVPAPSVAVSDPTFSERDTGALHQRRYWRGPSWINTAWLCWRGLVRLGDGRSANELAQRLGLAVLRSGLREYYNPFTGAGMGARDFSWSALVGDMLDVTPPRGRSTAPATGAPAQRPQPDR